MQRTAFGQALADGQSDRLGHVAGHQLDPRAALFTQQIEELLDRLAVAAGGGPDEPAAVVVDDDREVPAASSMREVIDPDALEPGEQVALRDLLVGDAFAD